MNPISPHPELALELATPTRTAPTAATDGEDRVTPRAGRRPDRNRISHVCDNTATVDRNKWRARARPGRAAPG
jgi:hypothetical protein